MVLLYYFGGVNLLVLFDVGLGWWACQQRLAKTFRNDARAVQEWVVLDLVNVQSFLWICAKYLRDEILSLWIDLDMVWKLVDIVSNPAISFLYAFCLKWRFSIKECVNDDS